MKKMSNNKNILDLMKARTRARRYRKSKKYLQNNRKYQIVHI